jgi:hypothetical protein
VSVREWCRVLRISRGGPTPVERLRARARLAEWVARERRVVADPAENYG